MAAGTVYLIHFDRKIGNLNNTRAQAQHYLGFSKKFFERMHDHANGQGSAIMAFLAQAKIGWQVARTWKGNRALERQLKNRKKAKQLCPICQALKDSHGSSQDHSRSYPLSGNNLFPTGTQSSSRRNSPHRRNNGH